MNKLSKVRERTGLASAFWQDRDGTVAALFGLMAIVLFLTIGAAVDFGRWLHARHTTIAAMDAAVLAAGRSLQVDGQANAAVAAAQAYYAENTQNRLPLKSDNIQFVVNDDGMSVTAGGNAFIETPFLSLVHINELPILDSAAADYSTAEVAVGGNAGVNLEISMMLDVTGSMRGQKLTDLKAAANDLVDIVVWDDQSEYSSRVALVPFSEGVRLPSSANINNVTGNGHPNKKTVNGWKYYRSHCVAERPGADAFTDAAPGNGSHLLRVYVPWSSGSCYPGATNKIVPLTNNKQKLRSDINQMTANGYTAGHIGTQWAWFTLSSNWNSLWSSPHYDATPYGTPETQKIAILMTDGEYNTQYDADGIDNWYTGASSVNGSSTNQSLALCAGMKAAGITVYTVGFGLSNGSTAAQTLATCATDASKNFSASDGEELRQAFRAIALELSKLRLSS